MAGRRTMWLSYTSEWERKYKAEVILSWSPTLSFPPWSPPFSFHLERDRRIHDFQTSGIYWEEDSQWGTDHLFWVILGTCLWGIFLIDMEKPRPLRATPLSRQGKHLAECKQASKQACIHFSLVLKVDVMWLFLSSHCHGDFSWIMDHNLDLSAYNKPLPPPVSFLSGYFIRAAEMKVEWEAARARWPWWAPVPSFLLPGHPENSQKANG